MNYFVAGLPRSRTAWLSAFLSQSGEFCFHEAINGCRSVDEYREKLGSFGDSSTGHHLIKIEQLYPDSKIIIIDKNDIEMERCIAWCDEEYGFSSRESLTIQRKALLEMPGAHIDQSKIDENLPFIFEYLTGKRFNDAYKEISNLNISVKSTKIDELAAKELFKNGLS